MQDWIFMRSPSRLSLLWPPLKAAFSRALIILTRWQRATRRRTRRREQSQSLAKSSLQTSWHQQKAKVRRNETALQHANSRHRRSADVKSLKESSVKASKHLNLISGSVSSCLERLTGGPSSLCTYCGYLTWYSVNGLRRLADYQSCVPNCILPFKCLSTVHFLCGALIKTWVMMFQTYHEFFFFFAAPQLANSNKDSVDDILTHINQVND